MGWPLDTSTSCFWICGNKSIDVINTSTTWNQDVCDLPPMAIIQGVNIYRPYLLKLHYGLKLRIMNGLALQKSY